MNRYYLLLVIISLSAIIKAQEFYDVNTIQTIEITFAESNWDALLDAEKAGDDGYIIAKSVSINGEVFDSVGVKYKGNSTYKANQLKNPFHIELDTYKDHIYEEYTDIKLSNGVNDPSFLREVLSYHIIRQYMDAPLSNFANVYVNGTLIGLYTNSEAVSKKFVKSRFGSKNNTFIKCNPPAGAGPNTSDLPNLVYLGQDSADYYDAFELKSDSGWNELIDLCDTLNNSFDAIEEILDVDRALWMLALDNVLVNLDSYIGAFSQNYYLYRDDNGRFVPVIWDLNESFGRFAQTGTTNLNGTTDKQRLSHLLHASDSQFPLVKMLLSDPMYKRMYLAHIKTILLENFDDNSYYDTGLSMQNTIKTAVQADANKFFTYSNFIDNLTKDISSGGPPGPNNSSVPGITSLMNGRSAYLLALSDFTNIAPEISSVALSDSSPVIGTSIRISASITNPSAVYIGFRNDPYLPFTRTPMYDDGTHDDLVAGDGIYSTSIDIQESFSQFYIYAENNNAGMFSPQGAEYEYHEITATISDVSVGDLVINEFMASNDATVSDQDDEYDDWLELYNNSSSEILLDAYYLSDDAEELTLWEFTSGTSIAANDYLIVWTDKDEDQTGLHANFKISASSGSIFLVDNSGTIVDEVTYTEQTSDISYGRYPNGTGYFQTMDASFGAENFISTDITTVWDERKKLEVYPNPATGYFYIDFNGDISQESYVTVYNLSGNEIYRTRYENHLEISAYDWESGIYFIRFENEVFKLMLLQ